MSVPVEDTIAAAATPPGRGGVGVIRISGPRAPAIAEAVLGRLPRPRYAIFASFRDADGDVLDRGLALYFPQPHSFTGEHVLELHGHGGPMVMDLVLGRVLELGARPARPGEFSERAFLNGKLDLAQAEAVADLIDSGSRAAARSAVHSLRGLFSERVHQLVKAVTELRVYVEAAIDFPEEEEDFLDGSGTRRRLAAITEQFDSLQAATRQGCLLRDGMTVALAGRPNAGKSSLLNLLAETDAAIVSAEPGTTRDLIRQEIQLDGLPLHVVDTAGLRETADSVETEGVRRARAVIGAADRVLVLVDDAAGESPQALVAELPAQAPVTIIYNKIDLSGRRPGPLPAVDGAPAYAVSAKTGAGVDALRLHLKNSAGYQDAGAGTFSARRRHLDALARAREHVEAGARALAETRAGELLAEELRHAQRALGEITGEVTSEDLLGRIFSSFCIGK